VETDNLVSELAQEMLEANSHATLVEIQRAHHMVFEENPDDFIVEVTRWLEETS
jgi:pimeloyl-ACP methyl ester carboxylesterase